MSDLFISYSRRDTAFAERLHGALAGEGLDVWRDAEDIPYGTEWWNRICSAIEDADGILFLLSPDWTASPTCRKELEHAVRHHKRLIPVAFRPLDGADVPAELSALNYVQVAEADFPGGVRRVVETLRTDYEWVQFHTWLLGRARDWEEGGRDRSRLLGGATLAATEQRLAMGAEREPAPTELQTGYVLASRQAETRRRRTERTAVTVFLVLVTVAAVVAWVQRGIAQDNAREAGRQSTLARAQRDTARQQRAIALANERIAKEQRALAGANERLAREQRDTAEAQRRIAERRRREAEREGERARGVAAASLARRPGSEMEALVLAVQAVGPALRRGEAPVPQAVAGLTAAVAAARHSLPLRGHTGTVTSAAFSPDGSRVLTGSGDRTVRLWDAENGRLLATLASDLVDHLDTWFVTEAAFSRDGARAILPVAREEGKAVVLDARTGRVVETLTLPFAHQAVLTQAVFASDGTPLATVAAMDSEHRGVQLRNARTGAVVRRLDLLGWAFLTLSPDGSRAVAGGQENVLLFWDTRADTLVAKIQGSSWWKPGAFSRDGSRLVVADEHGHLHLFTRDGEHLASFNAHPSVAAAVFSPDGARVLGTGWSSPALLDARTGKEASPASSSQFDTRAGHQGNVITASFSPDGSLIVTASHDGTARLWDADEGKVVGVLEGHASGLRFASFGRHPARPRVVTGSADNTARIWDFVGDGSLLTLRGHRGPVSAAAFSPDGRRVLTTGADSTSRLWDARTGRPAGSRRTPRGAGAPDRSASATVQDNQVVIRDPRTGKTRTIEGWVATARVLAAALSPDGSLVVATGPDIRLFDARTGARLATLHGHAGDADRVSFAPDGSRFVTAGASDWTVRVWDADTRRLVALLGGHSGPVRSAAFSPDGALLLTASSDSTARLWDVATGAMLAALRGHAGKVNAAAFSPDGRRAVTAGDDGTARVYDVEPAGLVARALRTACGILRHQPELARTREHCAAPPPPHAAHGQ